MNNCEALDFALSRLEALNALPEEKKKSFREAYKRKLKEYGLDTQEESKETDDLAFHSSFVREGTISVQERFQAIMPDAAKQRAWTKYVTTEDIVDRDVRSRYDASESSNLELVAA